MCAFVRCVVTALCRSHSYAPWCPACENLQPEWEKFAEWGEDLGVNVAKVDVTEQPGERGWKGLLNPPGFGELRALGVLVSRVCLWEASGIWKGNKSVLLMSTKRTLPGD